MRADGLPREVLVFAPYVQTAAGPSSPHYDLPEYRAEIAGWMRALGLDWRWVPVTVGSMEAALDDAERRARERPLVVFNLCDGTAVDGFPGLAVVEGLQRRGLAYTGADAAFYAVTTSKAASKERFLAAGVATAPSLLIRDPARDLPRAAAATGWPLFIKPDVSAGSYGIQIDSVVWDVAQAEAKLEQLAHGLHGQHFERGGMLAEAYVEGREFTVLVVEDPAEPLGLFVLAPGERVFDPRIPPRERFLAFERYWGLPEEERPIPAGDPYYWYAAAPPEWAAELADLSRRAFRAVGGRSYARVDIRWSARERRFFVLEVNAQCGLSSDDSSTVGSMLRLAGRSIVEIVGRVLRHAQRAAAPLREEAVPGR